MMMTVFKRKGTKNYFMRFRDRRGKTVDRSAKTTVKRIALERVREIAEREQAIREGRITERELSAERARLASIETHLQAHLADDLARGLHPRHRSNKASQLRRYFEEQRIGFVGDIDDRTVERHKQWLRGQGLSSRTLNSFSANLKRFASWCVEERLLVAHPCPGKTIRRENEALDRRRVRRPLMDEEIARLLAVVAGEDRAGVYEIATWTGLRRSEIERLRWGDVVLDGEDSYLRLRAAATKAKRADELPLHAEAVRVFERLRDCSGAPAAGEPVIAKMPTTERLYRDLDLAGIQKFDRPPGTNRRAVERNERGELVDFHALRTTFGSRLALYGVTR